MAFWKSAGYSGNHHIEDMDDCPCASCQYERKLLRDAFQLNSGVPMVEPPLPVRTFYHGRGRQIGYIDAHLPSYDIIYAGYRPKVVKTFAVSTAGRLPPKAKQICIFDDKSVIEKKIQRRIGEILSRLNYLASKAGMDPYEFRVSIQKDLEDELELDQEIKNYDEDQKLAVEAGMVEYVEDYDHSERPMMTPVYPYPETPVDGPRLIPTLIPDADRYEPSDEESSVVFDAEQSDFDAYGHPVLGSGDSWEALDSYGMPLTSIHARQPTPYHEPVHSPRHDHLHSRQQTPRLDPFHVLQTPRHAHISPRQDHIHVRQQTPHHDALYELRPPSRGQELLQDRMSEEWTEDSDESDMEFPDSEIHKPPEAFVPDEDSYASDSMAEPTESIESVMAARDTHRAQSSAPQKPPPVVQAIPEFKRPKTALRFFDERPGTAEVTAFLSNPPKIGDLDDRNLKEMNEYYSRALLVAQQREEFKSVQDLQKNSKFSDSKASLQLQ